MNLPDLRSWLTGFSVALALPFAPKPAPILEISPRCLQIFIPMRQAISSYCFGISTSQHVRIPFQSLHRPEKRF